MASVVSQPPSLVKPPNDLTKQQVRVNQESLMKRISGAVFSSSGETIPLIDIGPSFSDDASAKEAVAADIGKACREIGFFQITNHGISSQARQGVMEQARRFFHDLPQAKKDALHIKYSKLMRGYEPSGVSNVNPDDWKGQDGEGKETKEAYNWGYEPGLDATGGDGNYVELDLEPYPKGANVWPSDEDLPGLFDAIRQYHSEVLTLARHLAGLFALSLDLPESHFDKMMTHPGTIARLLYYPPQKPKKATAQDEEIGLGAHTDYECFTLLFSSETPGLEVLSPNPDENGRPKWISAPAHQDCFTVNIADFFERWTNGLYKSTVRVRLGRRQ